jgi:hypothetical protein
MNRDKIATLEKEVKERAKKDSAKEQAEAEQPIINPGGFGTLLLTQGAVGAAPVPPSMYTNGTGVRFVLFIQELSMKFIGNLALDFSGLRILMAITDTFCDPSRYHFFLQPVQSS